MNVIVVITDSLRIDHLGCYGNSWIQTPNIDRFAKGSTVFEHAYSEGLPTLPTRTAMFTGKYTFPFRGWQRLEHTDMTLAEVLWDKGYASALITDVYHMHKPQMGYGRGFDYVQWIRGQEGEPFVVDSNVKVDVDRYHKPHHNDERVRDQLEQYLKNVAHWKSDEDHFVAQVVKAGIKWLEEQPRKDNLFLWLDCFDPHEPWDPPEAFYKQYADPNYKGKELIHPIPGDVEGYLTEDELKFVLALYAGEVTLVDKWVGIFFDNLKEMGMLENTLIIYTTDHGEPFGEHHIIRKARPWPYEELSHIPFILRHPKEIGKGKRLDAFVETCDVMPTILDFLGIDGPPVMQGKSLLPLISGEVEKVRNYGYSGYHARSWSIRSKEWSYILWLPESHAPKEGAPWTLGGTFKTPRKPELYNRKIDPMEQNDVIDEYPDVADELELELRRFVATLR